MNEYCAIPYQDSLGTLSNHRHYYIFIRNRETQMPIFLTDYDLLLIEPYRDKKKESENRQMVFNFVRFLNWLNEDAPEGYRDSFKCGGVKAIDFEMAKIYLKLHSEGKIRGMRDVPDEMAQKQQREMLTRLLKNLYAKYRPDENKKHFWKRIIENGEYVSAEYELPLTLNPKKDERLLRYVPPEIGDMLLRAAYINDKGIYLALFFQRYCALREGEVCNVRNYNSKYGRGYKYRKNAQGKIVYFQIDLRKERVLRSDLKSTGRIKKERLVEIPPEYLDKHPEFTRVLIWQENMLKDCGAEKYGPMFVNNRKDPQSGIHYAMTVPNYTARVKHLIEKYVIPEVEASDNDRLKIWIDDYRMHTFGLHAMRHLASVEYVLKHCFTDTKSPETELMNFRGDRSPLSALEYLRHTKAYRDPYERAMNITFNKYRQTKLKQND